MTRVAIAVILICTLSGALASICFYDSSKSKSLHSNESAKATVPVVCAERSIPKGSVIVIDDVCLKLVDTANIPADALKDDKTQVYGQETNTELKTGQILRKQDINWRIIEKSVNRRPENLPY